jgi:hypothetical protein
MIWQVLNLKRYSVWVCLNNQANHVRLKGSLLISLISMAFKFINVDSMGVSKQISMALETELLEVDIINQVIQMKQRLKTLQV